MLLIISNFIEIAVCAGIFYFFPKKQQYEKEYLVDEYNKNYDDTKKYNISICDYYFENLKKPKEMSLIIFGLTILLVIFVVSRFITAIYNKCKSSSVNSAIRYIRASVILGFFIVIANIVLIFIVLNKIKKMYSDIEDAVIVTDSMKENLKILLYILCGDIILFIIQICVAFKKYQIGDIVTPLHPGEEVKPLQTTGSNNGENRINSVTSRSNVIFVRQKKNFKTLLKEVLPEEVSSNLDNYIERGKSLIVDLANFYSEMNFEGLTEKDPIINEINNIIMQLSELFLKTGDQIVKICFENIEEHEAVWFLLQYLFPFVLMVIKLKIEKGIYRKHQETTNNHIVILAQLERTIERDENGNERHVFRIRQNVSQSSIENLLG